jgi:hypothetical protein
MQRRFRAGLLSLLLVASGSTAWAQSQPAQRSTTDRPDDLTGYQIHVMYVLPSDGTDQHLDINGTIATSVAAIQKWFVRQTHGARSLRLDTSKGVLDVTFFRLSASDAQIAGSGPYVRDKIEAALKIAGFDNPNKLYAVYYGGSSTVSCGGGAWPPKLIGTVAALYLRGRPPGARACASNAFARSDDEPGYWEYSIIHEIFHTLGAVAPCAPHHTREGHVSDDPRDLMYAGKAPWRPSLLDIGNDDYFDHRNAGCLDVARSVFIDPAGSDAVVPPGWTKRSR